MLNILIVLHEKTQIEISEASLYIGYETKSLPEEKKQVHQFLNNVATVSFKKDS